MADPAVTFQKAKELVGTRINGFQELHWEKLPAALRQYLEAHPKLSAIQLIFVVGVFCPAFTVAPFLATLGFTSSGPLLGSIAAWWQSTFGVSWVFSGLQSAAMGGYGVVAVNGIAQGAAALSAGMIGLFR